MKIIDKRYITLQIKNILYKLNGSEFQSFFEDVMEKVSSNFQKIKPQGRFGDGGNDGFERSSGTYYQVYAPFTPEVQETEAAKKLKEDFSKLQISWGSFQEIKRYVFVFNDKYHGSTNALEKAQDELKKQYPKIDFDLCLAENFEKIVSGLNEEDLVSLGFSTDQRQAITIIEKSLNDIQDEIDRENVFLSGKYLCNIANIIKDIKDIDEENTTLEYEILECKYLMLSEKPHEAVQKYESISKRYPNDPRSFLYLAEFYLNRKDFKRNLDLLDRAKDIDPDFWLFSFLSLVRENRLEVTFNRNQIDKIDAGNESWEKATFYRLFSQLLEESGDEVGADEFIEKSIFNNPNRFSSYITRLSLWLGRLAKHSGNSKDISKKIIEEINSIRAMFSQNGEIRPRNKIILNSIEIDAQFIQGNLSRILLLIKASIDLILRCSLNQQIDFFLVQFLQHVSLPSHDLFRLLDYIEQSDYEISDFLAEILFGQLLLHESLMFRGKDFYEKIDNKKMAELIKFIENGEKNEIFEHLKDNERFLSILADTLKGYPDIRLEIIESSFPTKGILKKRHLLSFYIDQKDDDSAFSIIKELDLTDLSSIQCLPILDVLYKKEAWDMEIMLLEQLIEKEKNDNQRFSFSMQLFIAYLNMKMYQEAIHIGEILLKEDQTYNYLTKESKISLLHNTIFACFERGTIDQKQIKKAESLINQYKPERLPFEFRIGPEFEILLSNAKPVEALNAIIEAVKEKRLLSNQEYAQLHNQLLRIDNTNGIGQESLKKVGENCFIKLSKNDQWYYLGNSDSLDAIPIDEKNVKHDILYQKQLGSNIIFPDDYGPEIDCGIIKHIFPIEKYIYWKSIKYFQELSQKGDLKGVFRIEIPQIEDSVDPANLIKFFQDQKRKTQPIFDMYCQKKVPLAMLAMSEGGLINAVGRITQEGKGFITCNNGSLDDLERQKQLASSIIEGKLPFVLDSTSALFLVESGLLQKIHEHISNLVVPRSVLIFLTDVTNRFIYTPGQKGYMGFAKGKITISDIDKDRREQLKDDFISGISLLESNPENIRIISKVNKGEGFTERKIPDELCDAFIIAKMELLPVLTEDPLLIKFNEIETKQTAPQSFSIWSLARALYEMHKLSFDEYLDFFGYLSFYRFWFLPISIDDIKKTIFGDKDIVTIQPKMIKKLNFQLTLSDNYGVELKSGVALISGFFISILIDESINLEITKDIFLEILGELPFDSSKRKLGLELLNICHSVINRINQKTFPLMNKEEIVKKIDYLNKSIVFLSTDEFV